MKIPYRILLACTAFLVMTGCEKENTGSQKSNTENLAAAAWRYDNAMIDVDNNGTGDLNIPAGSVSPCQTDNILTFSANGTGVLDEGQTKCNTGDPQTTPFTWNFSSNETVLNISTSVFAGVSGDFKIIALTETEMKLSKSLSLPPSPAHLTVIVTFRH